MADYKNFFLSKWTEDFINICKDLLKDKNSVQMFFCKNKLFTILHKETNYILVSDLDAFSDGVCWTIFFLELFV